MTSGYRFLRLFLIRVALAVTCWLVLERVVDPRGYFDGVLTPITPSSRPFKARLLTQYARTEKVRGLVLGSSRTMMLDPGQRFFNASVYMAKPEDFLAFYRLARADGVRMDRVLLGVDDFSLSDTDPFGADLLACYPLLSEIEPGLRGPFGWARHTASVYKDSLTGLGAKEVFQSLRSWFTTPHVPLPADAVAFDSLVYYRRDGVLTAEKPPHFHHDESYESFLMRELREMPKISSRRGELFETLLGTMAADRVQAAIFITPYHPDFLARLRADPTAWKHHTMAVNYVEAAGRRFGFSVSDYTDPASFGADSSKWSDVVHYGSGEAAKVTRKLLSGL